MLERMRLVRAADGERLDVLGEEIVIKIDGRSTGQQWSLFETTVPEQTGPPLHRHPWDEAYYILSGEIEVQIGHALMRARTGDLVYAPRDEAHAFRGVSREPARMLIFVTPSQSEEFFRDVHASIHQMPQDFERLIQIAAKHSVTPVVQAVTAQAS